MPKKSPLNELSTKGFVSLNRFAKIAEVSYPTALAMKERGEIKTVQVGGVHRVYADEVRRFLEKEGNPTEVGKSQLRILASKQNEGE